MRDTFKKKKPTASGLYKTAGAEHVVVFVHGLGGDGTKSYWGELAKLLSYEKALESVDYQFWSYRTSKAPIPNLGSAFNKIGRIPMVEAISRSLDTYLEGLVKQHGYKSISIIGHSLGGLISVLTHAKNLDRERDIPIDNICLLASPQISEPIAKALISHRLNPHIKWLASDGPEGVMKSDLPNCRKAGAVCTYVDFDGDEVVTYIDNAEFDHSETVPGRHSRTADIASAKDDLYRVILNWMIMSGPARR